MQAAIKAPIMIPMTIESLVVVSRYDASIRILSLLFLIFY